jgi:hypothetical protein
MANGHESTWFPFKLLARGHGGTDQPKRNPAPLDAWPEHALLFGSQKLQTNRGAHLALGH